MKLFLAIGTLVLVGAIYLGMLVIVSQKDDSCAFTDEAEGAGGWTNQVVLFPPSMECRYASGETVRLGPFS